MNVPSVAELIRDYPGVKSPAACSCCGRKLLFIVADLTLCLGCDSTALDRKASGLRIGAEP